MLRRHEDMTLMRVVGGAHGHPRHFSTSLPSSRVSLDRLVKRILEKFLPLTKAFHKDTS